MPPDLLPRTMTIKNYIILIANEYIGLFAINTFFYAVISSFLSIGFCMMTSYFMLYGQSKISKFIFYFLAIAIIVPRFSLIIPQYVLLSKMNLLNNVFGISLPIIYNISGVLICKAYMDTIPRAFIDMTRIDGANNLQAIFYVFVPLSKPVLASIGTFQAIASASDFLWQTLVITEKAKNTLISGLPLIIRENNWVDMQNMGRPIGLSIASSVIMFLPLLLFFLIGNKYYRKLDLSYKE